MSDTAVFTWKIENFSCLKGGCLHSPSFETHSSEWKLTICPADRKGHVDLKLKKLDADSYFTLNCAIAFLDLEGSPLLWRQWKKCVFRFDDSKPFEMYINLDVDLQISKPHFKNEINTTRIRNKKVGELAKFVCGSMISEFVVEDILTVECHMWFDYGANFGPQKFFARTRYEPIPLKKKKKIVWNVNDVSFLAPNFTFEHIEPIQGTEFEGSFLMIKLTFDEREEFTVSVTIHSYRIQANFKISLLDVSGKKFLFANVGFDFSSENNKVSFDTNITKLMLMSYRNKFLTNETISLVFEYTLLYEISSSRLISENEYTAHNTQSIVMASIIPETKPITAEPEIESANNSDPPNINRALKNIYEEGFLSDFSLRVQDKTFPVHKAILGARSSVFRAMFTADMKEKESGSVDIPDVDADTIQRMLEFIYCDSVQEDMQWESATSLYTVADKCALNPLKKRCSDILKSELNATSVIGVLIFANSHHDQDLKATALDFILENDKEIVGTELWSKFAEEHNQLAFEAIQKLYLKKMDIQ